MSSLVDIPEWVSTLDVSALSKTQAREYLSALINLPGSTWRDDEDKLSYIAKVQEVRKHLASFPASL